MTDTPPAAPTAPRRAPVWMRVALVFSLAFNLLIVGIVAGAIVSGRAGGPPRIVDLSLGPLTRALSDEDRAAIGEALRSRDGFRPPRPVQRIAAAREVKQALLAEPFDREALARLLDAQRSHAAEVFLAGQDVLLDRLEAMTPEERRAFADRLAEEYRKARRPGRRDGAGGRDDPRNDD